MKTLDHNTINRFRSEKLSGLLKQIFSQIVLLWAEEGIVSLKEAAHTDGTKIQQYLGLYGMKLSHSCRCRLWIGWEVQPAGGEKDHRLHEIQQLRRKANSKPKPFSVDELYNNQDQDCLYCLMGQKMNLIGFAKLITASGGAEQVSSRYQVINCLGCPMRRQCHKTQENRIVDVNHRLKVHKEKADKFLNSDQGIRYPRKGR